MSACIYHDADAVAICPSCDFGVCQACLDGGSEGVCQTCLEEREFRQKNSAVQREYTPEAVVPRCNYCRAQADDETPLDSDGYCPTCSILARCVSHHDLIAVGPCKGCRRDFCRKCLGFTDVCPTCTAQNRVKTKSPTKPMAAGGRSPTRPMNGKAPPAPAGKVGTGKTGTGKTGTGKTGTGGMAKGAKGAPEDKPKRSRGGKEAVEAKLQAQTSGSALRYQIAGVAVAFLLLIFGGFSFLRASASSPEEQAKRLQEQMVAVHKAVLAHQTKLARLPSNQAELMASLQGVEVPDRKHLKVVLRASSAPMNAGEPNTVYYQPAGDGFVVVATDREGKPLVDARGSMIMLDQYTPAAP